MKKLFKEISISRTSCKDNCPIYQVTISSDGVVKWHGEKFVSCLGDKEFTLTNNRIKKLEDLLLSFDYKNFIYQSSSDIAADSPSCITRVVYLHGEVKTVVHDLGDRDGKPDNCKHSIPNLDKFERQIERIAGLNSLIKQTLYIYHIKNKLNDEEEYVLSSPSQEEAFKMVNLHNFSCKEWHVNKLGRDTTPSLHPYIIMSKANI